MTLLRYLEGKSRAFARISLPIFWLIPLTLWSRIEQPPSTIDLTPFISKAPNIFRGVVLDVSDADERDFSSTAIARIKVDRWYRGAGVPEETIRYRPHHMFPGHDCIDFKPGTHWLIFANTRNGPLELVDDCYGAVAISPVRAPDSQRLGMFAQMEADFIAGLAGPDPAGRLVSIQRLGGLKSASSRPALHRVIETGDSSEKQWATYAVLRTGDPTILSKVLEMFERGNKEVPPFFLAWELSQLTDRSAIPGLIDIVDNSPDARARQYAIAALGEKIQAREALPAIAARLEDSDSGVRFYALNAMALLTHEAACTLPMGQRGTNDVIEAQVRPCLVWWKEAGKQRFSPK